jgi:hypothetical protein
MERKRRPQRRAFAIMVKPGTDAERGAEQGQAQPGRRQRSGGAPDRLRLGLTGPGEPAPQPERMAGGLEDGPPVDDRRGTFHAKPHAFNDGGQCHRSITRPSMAACRRTASRRMRQSQAGLERVPGQQRVEARDRPGGALECTCDISKADERTACGARRGSAHACSSITGPERRLERLNVPPEGRRPCTFLRRLRPAARFPSFNAGGLHRAHVVTPESCYS